MKFMVIATYKDSWYALPPQKQEELINAAQSTYMPKWRESGKVESVYTLGNMKGVMAVFNLNSPEDLVRIAYENPIFSFFDAQVTPLVDMDVWAKARAK